jgi:hypothetical protein
VSIYKNESSKSVSIVLTILDLECYEGNIKCASFGNKQPSNAKLKYNFTENSFEFKCVLNPDKSEARYYRWKVKQLPTKIKPEKTKVKVNYLFLIKKLEKFLKQFLLSFQMKRLLLRLLN